MTATVTSREAWLKARMELLAAEKAFTDKRDELSALRRKMPWVKVDEAYVFEGPDGQVSLKDLFAGRSQLIVYHFMFAPENEWGCKSCSFWADHFDGAIPHLGARDTSFAVISRAPVEKLQRQAKRLGWTFPWVSSGRTSFNYDFAVSFAGGAGSEDDYNFGRQTVPHPDLPGFSVFVKGEDGAIHHAYSTYARGIEMANATYSLLDLTPKGRDEGGRIMHWVRFSDEYAAAAYSSLA